MIDHLVSSYLELPVKVHWRHASGLPFPDRFEAPRLEFAGLATTWLELTQVVWRAEQVRFVAGMPALVQVTGPRVEIAVDNAELDRWLRPFRLPYRLELAEDALVVHSEIAGFPLARFETRLEVVNGWFVLQPKRASLLGLPSYTTGWAASWLRIWLPLPPLAGSTQLESIEHGRDLLRLCFRLPDFEERVTPGLLMRLQKRLVPTLAMSPGDWLPGNPGHADAAAGTSGATAGTTENPPER